MLNLDGYSNIRVSTKVHKDLLKFMLLTLLENDGSQTSHFLSQDKGSAHASTLLPVDVTVRRN